MRKSLPISALITGLLAGPALGAAPLLEQRAPTVQVVPQSFPMAMPPKLEEELRKLVRGESLDAHGMQSLRRRLALNMQARLMQLRPGDRHGIDAIIPVQMAQLTAPGETVSLLKPTTHKEKAAFLGVATSPASATLRAQLSLERGMGLVVDLVEKDSPAESAGVKVHDVLQRFDEQLLVNAQQLAVLVRSKKPGNEIRLTLLRGGKSTTVTAKLIEKEVTVLEELEEPRLTGNAMPLPEGMSPERLLQNLPPQNTAGAWMNVNPDGTMSRRVIDEQNDITLTRDKDGKESLVVKDRQGHTLYEGTAEKADLEPDVMKKIRTMQQQAQAPIRIGPGGAGGTGAGGGAARAITATRVDDKYQITVTSDGMVHHVVAKDLAGKNVFEGGADGDAEFKAMPAEIAERVRGMLEKIK